MKWTSFRRVLICLFAADEFGRITQTTQHTFELPNEFQIRQAEIASNHH